MSPWSSTESYPAFAHIGLRKTPKKPQPGGKIQITWIPVLYGSETCTLTSRKERRLVVFENEVLRKKIGAKKDEVAGEWRKIHNAELQALYSSRDIIRNIKS
ncbi:hypothetical protein ANN_01300 [Periplaneta americana]|uniref:Uncharacterized protein n=1 Tax=Periplaneta americana TaxID=6978 RepID=A0ABQ8TTA2_PERAM|nr:hypothetical protein ANN_01300 [Periplaneta americana]